MEPRPWPLGVSYQQSIIQFALRGGLGGGFRLFYGEGHEIEVLDIFRAAVENGGVRGVAEGVYGFARRQKITGKRPDFAVAVRVGMRHDHGGGQVGDDAVAYHGR